MDTRRLFEKDKKVKFVVVGLIDSKGSLTPTTRSNPFEESIGIPDDNLEAVANMKAKGEYLEHEKGYTDASHNERLDAIIRHCMQRGTVIVDMMPFESNTMVVLESISSKFGCSLVAPIPRPSSYREAALKSFGDDRFYAFSKIPSTRKLLYAILESFERNPMRFAPIDTSLLENARDAAYLEDEEHIHGPGCSHDHHHHQEEHIHGPGCSHDMDDKFEARLEQTIQIFINNIEKSIEAVKKGNPVFTSAVARLSSFGADIPIEYRQETLDLTHGYSMFFVSKGILPALIANAVNIMTEPRLTQKGIMTLTMYLECLWTMATYNESEVSFQIRSHMCDNGIVEMIRMPSVDGTPGKGLLRHPIEEMQRMGRILVEVLQESGLYLRLCDACGKREDTMDVWRACSRCKFNVYCTKECQKSHWNEHKKVCIASS